MLANNNHETQQRRAPGAYQAQEQEQKPQALAQPQGASAVQPNAQPQTFATMQRQGFARPAPPPVQPQQQQMEPFVNAQSGSVSRAPQGLSMTHGAMGRPNAGGPANGGPMLADSAAQQGNYGNNAQGIPWEQLAGGRRGVETPAQQSLPNGFNGAAPNFNPMDYMIGQIMNGGQGTNFGQQAAQTQFQNYSPVQAPALQGAGTNYGQGGGATGNVSVQGGGEGVASNYSGQAPDAFGVGSFQNQGGPVADATQQKMLDILGKPSGWDSALVQNMYGDMGGQIDDQFQQQDTAINEEMAKRGLYDSSIAAGRLKDSNIGRRDAKTNLADSLLQQMGMNYGSDQARAAGLGAGYQGQQFGEGAQTFGLNQGAEQQAFGQRLGAENARQGAFGLNQQGQIANSNAGIAGMQANLQAQTANQRNAFDYAGLNSQNTITNNAQQLDRARFASGERQFGTNTANSNAQQRFTNQFQGGQQDFNNRITNQNQQRDMFGHLVNYGQQQFNNDMTQQQFNRQLSNDEWQRLMDSMGLR